MANKMLIDATHPEETRVVVLRGSRVDEFDFESASKRQLRGNIYLAKVIRVEPSLQAAFVDYGGNRHGFLAFSEIHPDYYQIPVSDRQALLEEEAAEDHEEEEERRPRRSRRQRGDRHASAARRDKDDVVSETADAEPDSSHDGDPASVAGDPPGEDKEATGSADAEEQDFRPVQLDAKHTPPYDDPTADLIEHASEVRDRDGSSEPAPACEPPPSHSNDHHAEHATPDASVATAEPRAEHHEAPIAESVKAEDDVAVAPHAADDGSSKAVPPEADADHAETADPVARGTDGEHSDEREDHEEEEHVDQLGGDAMEEVPRRAYRPRRQYKIQEVIKRRQVLLVQVVKEERGNKGAALTTYLSLAGRYSVLMPNTARGGGISRKITDAGDRQRLKSIAQDLEVPDGMGVILRTAGASRSKPEVKRDFEYLMRMWETVRETTLASTAPKLVYEEGSLIKRAIRDLYNSDVEEIVVAGDEGYREAKAFMRLLTPSHVKNVQPWRDSAPLFTKAGAESQLDAMFSNHVTLKSGGYIVINQTEALVAIDVNSGRSTREHNIEDTALRTNLEAADEVARQLRLRDLAGLIVVDFIDMEETRNNRAVERRIKDALKDDRARIQIGRISHFGLLEMSRQRIRTGVLEGSTEVCQHCAGAGMVRATASIALHVLRVLEDALVADATRNMIVRTRGAVALYILNFKRAHLDGLEGRFGVAVTFEHDEHLTGTVYCSLEKGDTATGIVRPARTIPIEDSVDDDVDDSVEETASEASDGGSTTEEPAEPRRRRRRRGRGRDRESSGIADDAPQPADDALGFIEEVEGARADHGEHDEAQRGDDAGPARDDEGRGRRRRSRRGGRRTREAGSRQGDDQSLSNEGRDEIGDVEHHASDEPVMADSDGSPPVESPVQAATVGADESTLAPSSRSDTQEQAEGANPPSAEADDVSAAPAPDAGTPVGSATADETVSTEGRAPRSEPVSSELDPSRPKRSGWWQRAKASISS